ncbi:hypothetical protein ABT061_32200 [Streptosporangium sp. NPDC002544]|uniref:hypothetical protein n=1 Tax=Streptosporangium sp. NPDC002544 TaxID=3154538 RepID=UPI00331A8F1E
MTASLVVLLALDAPAFSASSGVSAPWSAAVVTVASRANSLEITVPTSANLGSGARGATISASLGTVTVADIRTGVGPTWTATVSATDFATAGGSGTITKANVAYWSGPVTAESGAGTNTPGQATAAQKVALTAPVTAFSGRKAVGIDQSTSWQPTLVITIPSSAVAGTYTGTISHSVA